MDHIIITRSGFMGVFYGVLGKPPAIAEPDAKRQNPGRERATGAFGVERSEVWINIRRR
jgi:hypothetical protein